MGNTDKTESRRAFPLRQEPSGLASAHMAERARPNAAALSFGRAPFGHSVTMTKKDRSEVVQRARAALVVAAMRRSIMTYKELGKALGIDGIALRNEMRHILDDLSADCNARGERSLASLVVNQTTGAPGQGWQDGDRPWHSEVQAVFRQWAS